MGTGCQQSRYFIHPRVTLSSPNPGWELYDKCFLFEYLCLGTLSKDLSLEHAACQFSLLESMYYQG